MLCHRLALLAVLLAAPVAAQAQSEVDRANLAAAAGPIVLPVDKDRARFRSVAPVVPGPGERVVRAVPVPHVMNGGAFGYSGFDYFNEASSEGRLGVRRHRNDFILAPALVTPLPR